MARRRFGLCDADEADVVYIRRRFGRPKGKSRRREKSCEEFSSRLRWQRGRDSGAGGIGRSTTGLRV
jgi:hypothetical protein